MCVLEWCKLFGDKKGEYYWKTIVTDVACFKADLLVHLGLHEEAFNRQVHIIREYRDKWVAHLDLERVCGELLILAASAIRHTQVLASHPADQMLELRRNPWPAGLAFPAPEKLETLAVPTNEGFRCYDG
jgi:hypothetical protein